MIVWIIILACICVGLMIAWVISAYNRSSAVKGLKTQIYDLQKEVEKKKDTTVDDELEAHRDDLRRNISGLNKAVENINKSIEELHKQEQMLLNETAEKTKNLANTNAVLAEKNEKIHELEKSIAVLAAQKADGEKSLENQTEKLTQMLKSMREANLRAAEDFVGHGNKINISIEDHKDIAELMRFSRGMKCAPQVKKAVWDCYYKSEFDRMIKECACDGIAGIYRIYYYPKQGGSVPEGNEFSADINGTNTKSAAISYIGQSVNIGDRWIQHGKRAGGLDDVGGIRLYEKMRELGIEEFYWEVVEVVKLKDERGVEVAGARERLSQREKYWGDFYCCKENGLNCRLG